MPGTPPRHTRLFEMSALVDRRVSDRKRRLFAVACLRRVAHLIADPRCLRALEVAETFAEGLATQEQLQEAEEEAFLAHLQMREGRLNGSPLDWSWAGEQITRAAALVVSSGLFYAEDAVDHVRRSLSRSGFGWVREQQEEVEQCRLLEDIIGPSSGLFVDPLWLASNDHAVENLAQHIYDTRAFDLYPILADALEDGGCSSQAFLDHLRGDEVHVRGCWVLDLLTGRE